MIKAEFGSFEDEERGVVTETVTIEHPFMDDTIVIHFITEINKINGETQVCIDRESEVGSLTVATWKGDQAAENDPYVPTGEIWISPDYLNDGFNEIDEHRKDQ
jgi:hypothetical protein